VLRLFFVYSQIVNNFNQKSIAIENLKTRIVEKDDDLEKITDKYAK
jgi:hypothetical protein